MKGYPRILRRWTAGPPRFALVLGSQFQPGHAHAAAPTRRAQVWWQVGFLKGFVITGALTLVLGKQANARRSMCSRLRRDDGKPNRVPAAWMMRGELPLPVAFPVRGTLVKPYWVTLGKHRRLKVLRLRFNI